MSRRWLTRYERFMIFPQFIKNWSKSEKSKNWNSFNHTPMIFSVQRPENLHQAVGRKQAALCWLILSFSFEKYFARLWNLIFSICLHRFETKIEFFRRYLLIQLLCFLFQIQAKFVTVFYHLSWLKNYAEPLSDYKSTFFVQQAKYILLADVPLSSMMGN